MTRAPIIKLRKVVAPQFAIQDSAFLVLGAWDVGFLGEPLGNTSKKLDKNVVVRVILHGQCSLQRKEAIYIETTSKGDHDRGRFGHCFEFWCLFSKERDCHHKRRDNRLLEIKPSPIGLKKLKKSIASPEFPA